MRGWVRKSTGSWYSVEECETHVLRQCRIRGKIRLKGIRSTNPVAVGDYVSFVEDQNNPEQGIIEAIEPRKNYLIRKSVKLSHESHILATNVDQLLLFVTLNNPVTLTGFIDRVLVTAEAYDIPAILVFNKMDLYNAKDLEKVADLIAIYENAGYQTEQVSLTERQGLETIIKLMEDKVSMLSGHSGVGKSSLIKAIDPEIDVRVGDISNAHRSGQHTTTFAELFTLNNSIHIIDTPGIRAFGVIDFDERFLSHYFPEMAERMHDCKYSDCLHLDEPKCAIKTAIENGEISEERYKNYVSIYYEEKGQGFR